MALIIGDLDSQAAVFVFKNDGARALEAFDKAKKISHTRLEWHTDRDSFLAGISQWTSKVDRTNAFLSVYAHMGSPGMAPTPKGPLVSWSEFRNAVGRVATLWLLGCESWNACRVWPTPFDSPVSNSLLVTRISADWMPLVELFNKEISLNEILSYDAVERTIRSLVPDKQKNFRYLDASNQRAWRPFLPSAEQIEIGTDLTPEMLSQILWPDEPKSHAVIRSDEVIEVP